MGSFSFMKDGSEQWLPLKLLKESHPVETAEFAAAHDIVNEPACCWWVPFVLRKRDRIISTVTKRVTRVTHKYGIEIPQTINQALELDQKMVTSSGPMQSTKKWEIYLFHLIYFHLTKNHQSKRPLDI